MSQEKAPAFQFYPKDFLTDGHVMAMNLTELGAYTRLLCLCWMEQSLPMDMAILGRRCGVSAAVFTKLWPALEPCFTVLEGRLVQPRIERERRKQSEHRAAKAAAGQKGGRAKAATKQEPSRDVAEPSSSSSSSSSSSERERTEEPASARSKRPIFSGQRLTVFEWQLDDCTRTLGEYTDDFDLHSWFYALDAQAVTDGLVIPKRDGGEWLQSQLLAEAQRRGLPLRMATAPQVGKLTSRMAAMVASARQEGGR